MKLNEVEYDTGPQQWIVVAEMYKEDPEVIGPFRTEEEAKKYIKYIDEDGIGIDWYDYSIRQIAKPKEFIEWNSG